MTEIRQRNLISAGQVKTESALGKIGSGKRPSVENNPCIPFPDLMDNFGGRHANLKSAITLFIALVRNLNVCLLAVANVGAIEIVLVDLEQIVVIRAGVVEHPLQPVTFRQQGGKHEGS